MSIPQETTDAVPLPLEEPPSSETLNRRQRLKRSLFAAGRETWNAFKLILVLLILCGVVFPFLVFVIGQVAFHQQANGSLITNKQGQVIGSTLLGQQFTQPTYFHGRPSVIGYDASNS